MKKSYTYVNALGRLKTLEIGRKEDDKYLAVLWDGTGEYCGSAWWTEEEIKDFLKNYGINA